MLKKEIIKKIISITGVEYDSSRKYGLKHLRKDFLIQLYEILKTKEQKVKMPNFIDIAKFNEEKYDLCTKCEHYKETPFGTKYCTARRILKNINPKRGGPMFEICNDRPKAQEISFCINNPQDNCPLKENIKEITVGCNRFMPQSHSYQKIELDKPGVKREVERLKQLKLKLK